MSTFSGMKDAKRGFASNRFTEGEAVVRIDGCTHFSTDIMGECYKVTMTLLRVVAGPHKEGEVCTATLSFKQGTGMKKEAWFGKIKAFIGNVLGLPDDSIDETMVLRTLAEHDGKPGENAMAGIVTVIRASLRASKKSKDDEGNPRQFSNYAWTRALDPVQITEALGVERIAHFFPKGL